MVELGEKKFKQREREKKANKTNTSKEFQTRTLFSGLLTWKLVYMVQ